MRDPSCTYGNDPPVLLQLEYNDPHLGLIDSSGLPEEKLLCIVVMSYGLRGLRK